jgi:acetyl esterase/lipase
MLFIILQKCFAVLLAVIACFTNFTAGFKTPKAADADAIRVKYGEGVCENYDMFLPSDKSGGDVDVVLMIHGGAWTMGDQTEFENDCKEAAEKYGYAAVTVDYDKIFNGATSSEMVQEIYTAVSSVKATLEDYGYTADKMAVAGHSAGAHIALLYSYTHYEDSPIDIAFVVSNCAPADFFSKNGDGTTKMEKYRYLAVSGLIGKLVLPGHEAEMAQEISAINPIDHVTSSVPPTIVVQGA